MKVLQSSLLRAVVAIIVGVLLVKYREDTMRWMTIAAGILFFLSGLISVIVYYYEKRETARSPYTFDQTGNEIRRHSPIFPFIGVGSMLLGIILMVMPTDLLIGVTYVSSPPSRCTAPAPWNPFPGISPENRTFPP